MCTHNVYPYKEKDVGMTTKKQGNKVEMVEMVGWQTFGVSKQ